MYEISRSPFKKAGFKGTSCEISTQFSLSLVALAALHSMMFRRGRTRKWPRDKPYFCSYALRCEEKGWDFHFILQHTLLLPEWKISAEKAKRKMFKEKATNSNINNGLVLTRDSLRFIFQGETLKKHQKLSVLFSSTPAQIHLGSLQHVRGRAMRPQP